MRAISGLKVLVVEDNRTQAESLRNILEKGGHEVVLASNGEEGLELVQIQRPDLILSDVIMSPMDGYELCKRIKEDEKSRDIPIILVTYLYNLSDVIKALESGADNFIIKPYNAEYIFSRIIDTIQAIPLSGKGYNNEPIELSFSNRHYNIASGPIQILNILLSTYDTAIKNYNELQVADERLHYLNAQLQKAVSDLKQANKELHQNNIERGHLEVALNWSNKKIQTMTNIIYHVFLSQFNPVYQSLEKALACLGDDHAETENNNANAYRYIKDAQNIIKKNCEPLNKLAQSPSWMYLHILIQKSINNCSIGEVRINCDIPKDIKIHAYPLIEKVFSELIDNSIRHGKKTTTIRFSTLNKEDDPVLIYEDDGVGIPHQDKEKIFSPDYCQHAIHGLFLSKQILSITGITICETGRPVTGVLFEIHFPHETINRDK